MTVERFKGSCPKCGAPVNRVTSVAGPDRGVEPGDLAICSCRAILRFGSELKLEPVDAETIASLPRSILSELLQAVGGTVEAGSLDGMVALDIGPAERDRARELVAFATAHPIPVGPMPEDGRPYRMTLREGWRISFSFTHAHPSGLFRHLTIVHETGVWPHPMHIQIIGALFGFEGDVGSWLVTPESNPGCTRRACPCHRVVALQPVSTALSIILNAPGGQA